jgi:ankyrin repeat protein
MRFGVALICVMAFASGCGPSEQERFEAKRRLAWHRHFAKLQLSLDIEGERADNIRKLISEGVDVNFKDPEGMTPLMFAVQLTTPDIATLLIDAGANVNVKNDYGKTALNLAPSPEIIDLLKAAGAKE